MLTQLVILLNHVANAIGDVVLAPVAWTPGWLSATLVGCITGVLMLWVFKHTSNQPAIKRARDRIKANMLALSLFKDDLRVSLRCQARLVAGAFALLRFSLIPVMVLTVPMILVLGQLALWYQARPLSIGEASVVTVMLHEDAAEAVETISLVEGNAAKVAVGPVRVPSKQMVCWNIIPSQPGLHQLEFQVDDTTFTKQLAVGAKFMPTSLKRPGRRLNDTLIHPRETPFALDSVIQSIEITYPERTNFTSGTNTWVIYWFFVSMLAAFAAKPFLNVNL